MRLGPNWSSVNHGDLDGMKFIYIGCKKHIYSWKTVNAMFISYELDDERWCLKFGNVVKPMTLMNHGDNCSVDSNT